MKAIVFSKNGKPDKLVLQEVDKSMPLDNEVLVRIHAVSVNAADYRSMQLGIVPKKKIFGADVAGVVEAIGKNVTKFRIGDAVFGDLSASGSGGFAEYVAAPESALAIKPSSVSFEDAAAVPMAALTALQALRDLGQIKAGQQVLIYGSGGGVGTFAVQLAKYFGAEVTAVCSAKNVEQSRSLGAEHIIDYLKSDALNGRTKFDVILAINGNRRLIDYKRVLKSNGNFVLAGGAYSQIIRMLLFGKILSIGGKKMRFLEAKPNVKDLEFVIRLIEAGKMKAVIDRQFSLPETSEAVKYLKQGHAQGKVVISIP
ncbi:MAG TPA: NAD(P)-dependent alcohol dehydrogenase [Anaerolineaceae bacterium]|nr:NAD(P)-dependent alcohol dehydrogenase [Anaerolineaceae bacterium]